MRMIKRLIVSILVFVLVVGGLLWGGMNYLGKKYGEQINTVLGFLQTAESPGGLLPGVVEQGGKLFEQMGLGEKLLVIQNVTKFSLEDIKEYYEKYQAGEVKIEDMLEAVKEKLPEGTLEKLQELVGRYVR